MRMAQAEWFDDEAGPIVRPYAVTGGRTRHGRSDFDLIAIVVTVDDAPADPDLIPDMNLSAGAPHRVELTLGPEHEKIVMLCQSPLSVAEVASELDLPLGVVRVLLGDLLEHELILVRRPAPVAQFPNERVLKDVIDGLHAL